MYSLPINPKMNEVEDTWSLKDFLKENITCNKNTKVDAMQGLGGVDGQGFTTIGEHTVTGGMKVMIGHREKGSFYVKLHNESSVQLHGSVKIVAVSPTRDRSMPLIERYTKSWNDEDPTNLGKNPTLTSGLDCPLQWLPEDYIIQLRFKPETDGETIDYDNTNNVGWIDFTTKRMR